MSWWVGLSREEFWRECRTHRFSTNWRTQYHPTGEETRYGREKEQLERARGALEHYRGVGFDIAIVGVTLVDVKNPTEEFEVIPYYERQSALENR